jgi:hypothetical protein
MNCITSTGTNTGTFMSALDGIYKGLMNIQSQGTAGWERVEGHKWPTCNRMSPLFWLLFYQ